MNCSSDIDCILDMLTTGELAPKCGTALLRPAEYCCRCTAARGGNSREGGSISVLDWESKRSGRFSGGRVPVFRELACMPVWGVLLGSLTGGVTVATE
jgi:hypothetical protein